MTDVVLDTSAVLAVVFAEKGAAVVAPLLGKALVSAVNLSEAVSKLLDRGATIEEARAVLSNLSLSVAGFDADQAWAAGALRSATRMRGLSLGDRACLALAGARGVPAITADRAWAEVDAGVEVRVIR